MLEYMSGIHSSRPFLHLNVILVTFALCVLFSTERVGHTSLPQYHRGSDAVLVQFQRQSDEVEAQFYVICTVLCYLFFLTHATDNILLVIRLTLMCMYKQVGSYIIRPYRDHG